jgi:hypothetical protein
MRLSEYPYVVVRLECAKCGRKGQYRLARLAERYGAEMTLPWLRDALTKGCIRKESVHASVYDVCGATFVDITARRPPDVPGAMRPKLMVVHV